MKILHGPATVNAELCSRRLCLNKTLFKVTATPGSSGEGGHSGEAKSGDLHVTKAYHGIMV